MAKNTGKVREFCQSGKVGTLERKPYGCEILSLVIMTKQFVKYVTYFSFSGMYNTGIINSTKKHPTTRVH